MNNYIKKVLILFYLLLLLFPASYFMCRASGETGFLYYFLFSIFLFFCSLSINFFYFFVIPIILIYSIYSPFGLLYDGISYDYFASVFLTNNSELKELLQLVPHKYYLYSLLIIISITLFIIFRRLWLKPKVKINKILLILILIICFFLSPFFKVISDCYKYSFEFINELNEFNNISNEWGEVNIVNNDDEIYVLIIGESARKDYHHAYGYPLENTPFMSKSNGVLIDGFTTSGVNTVPSLKSALTLSNKKNKETNYNLNLIDLIKSSGFKTYWLSNQGLMGIYDSPISKIALRSDYSFFIKKGDYSSLNSSDFILIPHFKKILESKNKKFIVLHLYGSHPDPCERIFDYENKFTTDDIKYKFISCYISSINKTDDFIKEIHQILSLNKEKNDESFTIIYFSDHGISHTSDLKFTHFAGSKQQYEIPLFMVSSHSTNRKNCKAFKTNLNFTEELANFMHINNHNINIKNNLFDCQNDDNDYGEKDRIENLNNDNIIDISNL